MANPVSAGGAGGHVAGVAAALAGAERQEGHVVAVHAQTQDLLLDVVQHVVAAPTLRRPDAQNAMMGHAFSGVSSVMIMTPPPRFTSHSPTDKFGVFYNDIISNRHIYIYNIYGLLRMTIMLVHIYTVEREMSDHKTAIGTYLTDVC